MRTGALALALGLLFCCSTFAQDYPRAEVFGGYSYLNIDTNNLSSRQSANGWEAAVSGNTNRWLGFEGDFSGYYKSIAGVSISDYGFLGGPRFNARPAFVHALVGVDRLTGSDSLGSATQTSFAAAFGGGVEIPVAPHFAIRGSGDYVLTRHNIFAGNGVTQNNFRASVGVVFTFGGDIEGRARGPRSPKREEAERSCLDETDAALLGVRGCAVAGGFRVSSVKRESVAERAGINSGDIIIAVDDRPIRDAREIEAAIAANAIGTIKISYLIKGAWSVSREVRVR